MALDSANCSGGNKIWRNSSYDFWKNQEKTKNQKEDEENFDFMQSNQDGQFLNGQEASCDFRLDMDLEMDELRAHGAETGSRISIEQPVSSQREYLRRRQNSEEGGDGPEIVRCSSNMQFQRQTSNVVKAKTRSRLMDPPTPERSPISAKTRSRLMDQPTPERSPLSGLLGKSVEEGEEEEEDPLFGEDLPELRKEKLSVWIVLEWVSLVLIIASVVCSLAIPYLREKKVWKLMLWKWGVLVLVLICGRLVSGWIVRIIVFLIERNFLILRKRVLYFVYGVRKAVQNCLWLGLVLITWHYMFGKKVQSETNIHALKFVTTILACLLVGVMLWLVKTLLVKVLASSFHMSTYFDRIQDSLFNQYVIEALSGPPLTELQKRERRLELHPKLEG